MSDSRERFEAWTQESPDQLEIYTNGALKGEYCDLEMQYAWRAWQAAEHEAVRRCASLYCVHCANDVAFDASTGYHPANNRGGVFDCSAARIRKEFPEAWK